MQDRLAEYRAVVAKVDAKFEEIRARHAASFACASGCHACCAPGLTVSGVEKAAIAEHIQAHDLQGTLEALDRERPHGDARCRFLDAAGQCAIYAVRPIVCRSHGAPVRVPGGRLDACPLNFRGVPLDRLAPTDSIHVETLSTLLFVIGRRFDPQDEGRRFPLTVAGLLTEG
jgi:hypothetical protein